VNFDQVRQPHDGGLANDRRAQAQLERRGDRFGSLGRPSAGDEEREIKHDAAAGH
jgi:hypothetical protein